MAAKTTTEDTLDLRDNGTVRLAWDQIDITLRRPKIGEWLSYLEEADAADTWATTQVPTGAEGEETRPRTLLDLIGTDGPYLSLYQRILAELGDTKAEREDLAPWLCDNSVIRKLSAHWRANPLTRGADALAQATATP